MTYEETMAILDVEPTTTKALSIMYNNRNNISKSVSWIMQQTGCEQEIAERIVHEVIDDLPEPTITAVRCPYCKSTNVKKIGVVSRSMSVGMFGLGSSKIGKQWHCNGCKSDF